MISHLLSNRMAQTIPAGVAGRECGRRWRFARACGASVLLLSILAMSGCRPTSTPSSEVVPVAGATETPSEVDPPTPFQLATRAVAQRRWDEAAESIDRALIAEPERLEVLELAARIAVAQSQWERVQSITETIPIDDARVGLPAAAARLAAFRATGAKLSALQQLRAIVTAHPAAFAYRHELWKRLTRDGLREEASRHADWLCLVGQANFDEICSLLVRNQSFAVDLNGEVPTAEFFTTGLSRARFLYRREKVREALEALETDAELPATERPDADPDYAADADALRGRLLAEAQRFDDVRRWHGALANPDRVRRRADYWVAVGRTLADAGAHQAASRALLEAILRDDTDVSIYRIAATALQATGQQEPGNDLLRQSVRVDRLIDNLKQMSDANRPALCQKQANQLLELGRPHEAMQWFLEALPPGGAPRKRAEIEYHRAQLSERDDLTEMRRSISLASVDPKSFEIAQAMRRHLGISSNGDSSKSGEIASSSRAARRGTRPRANPVLRDVAESLGLRAQWYHREEIHLELLRLHEALGGGVAVLDYDLDGRPDLYLNQGSGDPPQLRGTRSNQLWRNRPGAFDDVTTQASVGDFGYSLGIAAGDVNQDGFPDLYLGNLGTNRLWLNNGDGTFREATESIDDPDPDPPFTTSTAIADVTGDALPDLIEINYVQREGAFQPPPRFPDGTYGLTGPANTPARADRWFENRGDGTFAEIRRPLPREQVGSGLGVVVGDIRQDESGERSNECFVSVDARPNQYWQRSVEGAFRNRAYTDGLAFGDNGTATAAMGIATGDFDRDGRLDFHITNFAGEDNCFYLQTAPGLFRDLAIQYRLDELSGPMLGFATKAIDWDRDGWLDLFVTHGHVFDRLPEGQQYRQRPKVWMHHGDHYETAPVGDPSGYFETPMLGRATATLDYDGDGRLDLAITHLDHPFALLRNETETDGNYLQLELVGTRAERDATGAVIDVVAGGETWRAWVVAGDGYLCTDESVLEIGLGSAETIERVEIRWPSGTDTRLESIRPNRRYLVVEGSDSPHLR